MASNKHIRALINFTERARNDTIKQKGGKSMEVKEKMLSKQQIALIRYLLGAEVDTPKNTKAEVQRAETGEIYKCAIYNTPYGSFAVLTENTPEKFAEPEYLIYKIG